MKTMRKKLLPLLIAISLGTLSSAGMAAKSTDQTTQNTSTKHTISSHQQYDVSFSAANVLVHIAQARSAIHDKDQSRAEKELGAAGALLAIIKDARPTAKAIKHTQVAKEHLNFKKPADVTTDLIPIYSDLTAIEDIVPVHLARKHLEKAGQALKKGDKEVATNALVAVQEALIYTEMDLPLSSTAEHIATAQKALANGNLQQADKALEAAEGSVLYLSMEITSPLAEVRSNLYLARQDYSAKNFEEAKADLLAARKWLEVDKRSIDKTTTDAVDRFNMIRQMGKQIDKLAVKLDQHDKDFGNNIEGILKKIDSMVERELEKAFIGWKEKRPKADLRADLIEAKQHVAFAENMQFYAMSDPADIFQALDTAKSKLDSAARGNLDEKSRKELNQALKELAIIRKDPKQRDLYESIRARLRGLIHNKY